MKENPSSSEKNLLPSKRPKPPRRRFGKKARFRLSVPSQSIPKMSLPSVS